MKVIIYICFILLLHTWINVPFILDISCEGLSLLPLTSKGVYKIFIYKLIPYQQGCVLSLLIKFDITSQKGEKELKGIFLI
jgi:hypothetical protein